MSHQKKFKCRHCLESFEHQHQLGGHTRKEHPYNSVKYSSKNAKRKERVNQRLIRDLARDILIAMKTETLDALTFKFFKMKNWDSEEVRKENLLSKDNGRATT